MKIDWGTALAVMVGMVLFTIAVKFVLPKLGIAAFEYEFERQD